MIGPTTVMPNARAHLAWAHPPGPTSLRTRSQGTAIHSSSNGNGKATAPIENVPVAPVATTVASSVSSVDIPTSATALKGRAYWQELLNPPDPDIIGPKHRSASDAGVSYWRCKETPLSMTDARTHAHTVVLRRKGHLKEQDHFIEFMLRMHETHTSLEVRTGASQRICCRCCRCGGGCCGCVVVTLSAMHAPFNVRLRDSICQPARNRHWQVMQKMERWILEHRKDPRSSKLKRMVPTVGTFFTPMRLVEAFREYDEFFALSKRQFVPPNFAEIRHILNIAQVGGLVLLCACWGLCLLTAV